MFRCRKPATRRTAGRRPSLSAKRLLGEGLEARQLLTVASPLVTATLPDPVVGPLVTTWTPSDGQQQLELEDRYHFRAAVLLFRPTEIVVGFNGNLNNGSTGDAQHSVLNRANWQLWKNNVDRSIQIASIEEVGGFSRAYRVSFAAPLEPGDYRLLARDEIQSSDLFALNGIVPINGNRDYEPGGDAEFEFVVSTATSQSGQQKLASGSMPAIARNSHGEYVVAWWHHQIDYMGNVSTYAGGRLLAQRYDAEGQPLGEIVVVGEASQGSFSNIDVVLAENGQFVVGWQWTDRPIASSPAPATQMHLARFDVDGEALGELESPPSAGALRDMALGPNGELLVVSMRESLAPGVPILQQSNDNLSNVILTRYAADGSLLGESMRVAVGRDPQVAVSDASILLTWSAGHSGTGGIVAQRFTLEGVAIGDPYRVNWTPGGARSPQVAALGDNGWVVTWSNDAGEIFAQRISSSGNLHGPAIVVRSAPTNNWGLVHSVVTAPDGSFLVTWIAEGAGNVESRAFNPLGTPVAGPALLGSSIAFETTTAAVALGKDRWRVAWTSTGDIPNSHNINYAAWSREFSLAEPLVVDLNGDPPGVDYKVNFVPGGPAVPLADTTRTTIRGSEQILGATVILVGYLPGDSITSASLAGTNIQASYAGGVMTLTGLDSAANYAQALRGLRFSSTAARAAGDKLEIGIIVGNGALQSQPALSKISIHVPGRSTIAGRHLFYNNSSFDGNDPEAGASDNAAIATDKVALPTDQAGGAANVTSYSRGINGIMIDVAGDHGDITVDDFIFRVGVGNDPAVWAYAPEPLHVIVDASAGASGSDRIKIVWADDAIKNAWLQVIVLDNGDTGLAQPDVFFIGNQVGDIGNDTGQARVNAVDAVAVINRLIDPQASRNVGIADQHDFDRDGRITAIDAMIVINRLLGDDQAPLDLIEVAGETAMDGAIMLGASLRLHSLHVETVQVGTPLVDPLAVVFRDWDSDEDLDVAPPILTPNAPLMLEPDRP